MNFVSFEIQILLNESLRTLNFEWGKWKILQDISSLIWTNQETFCTFHRFWNFLKFFSSPPNVQKSNFEEFFENSSVTLPHLEELVNFLSMRFQSDVNKVTDVISETSHNCVRNFILQLKNVTLTLARGILHSLL